MTDPKPSSDVDRIAPTLATLARYETALTAWTADQADWRRAFDAWTASGRPAVPVSALRDLANRWLATKYASDVQRQMLEACAQDLTALCEATVPDPRS